METESTALVLSAPTNVEAFSTSPSPEAPVFSLSTIENASPVLENQMAPDYIDAEIIELAEGDPQPPVIEIFIPGEEQISEATTEEVDIQEPPVEEKNEKKPVLSKTGEDQKVPEEHFREEPPEQRTEKDEEDEEQKKERQKQESIKERVEQKVQEARKLAEAELERRVNQIEHILLEKYGYEQSITLAGITSFITEVLIEESESDAMPYVEVYMLFEANITLMTKDGAIQLDGKLKGAGSSIKAVSYTEVMKTGTTIAELGSKKLLEEKERMFAWAQAKNAFKKAMEEYAGSPAGEQEVSLLAKAEEASRLIDALEHEHIASQVKQEPFRGIIDFLAVTMSHSSNVASAPMEMAA